MKKTYEVIKQITKMSTFQQELLCDFWEEVFKYEVQDEERIISLLKDLYKDWDKWGDK